MSINNVIISYYYLIGVSQENLIMNKKYNNISDVSTNNLYKMLDDVKYQDADNQAMIKSEISFRQCNDLKAWQDGSLVNDKALKRLSLKELNEINDMLSRAGY